MDSLQAMLRAQWEASDIGDLAVSGVPGWAAISAGEHAEVQVPFLPPHLSCLLVSFSKAWSSRPDLNVSATMLLSFNHLTCWSSMPDLLVLHTLLGLVAGRDPPILISSASYCAAACPLTQMVSIHSAWCGLNDAISLFVCAH